MINRHSSANLKLAWIIEGEPHNTHSYLVQIRLFSKYLDTLDFHSHIINYTNRAQDIPRVIQAISDLKPDILLNIGDSQMLDLAKVTKIPTVFIVTNGIGIAPFTGSIPNSVFACTTKYAQKIYQQARISPTHYFPHGFDPAIFFPGDRQEARRRLGWTHTKPTILMLGTNYLSNSEQTQLDSHTDRKNFIGGLQAFARALTHNPHLKLYLHTNAFGAVDIRHQINQLKLHDSVMLADTTPPSNHTNIKINTESQNTIADLFRASNVLLFPSLGESFGVPLIEAQACGLPVITTNAGPMPELVKTGIAVAASSHPAYPGWGIPHTNILSTAILRWSDTGDPKTISQKIQPYAAPSIIHHQLVPLLRQLTTAI